MRGTLTIAGCAIHFNLGYHRNVGGHGLVARIADAPAAPPITLLARFPAGGLAHGLDHGALALVLDVREGGTPRIDAGGGRSSSMKDSIAKHVGIGAELCAAPRCAPDGP